MQKIKVTTGVYWVEIPQAHLRILCGCPADSVKHLMRRGLIAPRQSGNFTFENGPNAILLSDISILNGRFANLGEFPVLQMLYRQGMIIPGHPNNTGLRPLLIGSRGQVESQVEYIFRGNYGLTTEAEIVEAGVPPDQAGRMLDIKLRFAFGRIRKTEDLLETRVVPENDWVELRDGAFIRRVGANRYQFRYAEDTVEVDLNLTPREEYESSYHLGYHAIRREYFSIIHSGEGDGWDVHRPCMSSIVVFQGRLYLIDAGPNLLDSLTALGISVDEIEGVFHTHCHDDHFNGLTVLLRADHRIKYFATKLVRHSVQKKLASLTGIEESDFARYFELHDLQFDTWNDVEGLEVKPLFSPHPVETSILLFRALGESGYKTYAHLADISSQDVLQRMADKGPHSIAPEYVEEIMTLYRTGADLKKIDAGGGMIHGNPADFRGDPSKRLILSHSSTEFSGAQREIGSTASFGTVDVLIASNQDYSMQAAAGFFRTLFPAARETDLRILLNCPIVSVNPGTILVKKSEKNDFLYLVLSGVMEFLLHEKSVRNWLSAGSVVGELSGIVGSESAGTYRTVSHVRVLRVPCNLYIEFLKRTGKYLENLENIDLRRFLQTTWLFGELLSCQAKSRLARSMACVSYPAGTWLDNQPAPTLCLVSEGEIGILRDDLLMEKTGRRGFYGEESILQGKPRRFRAQTLSASRIYRIPAEQIESIPIVQWKLVETLERRRQAPVIA